jgi:dephospho-CoA kinase
MRVVGLTGGIGSGKSTVARIFAQLGVPVYDSDKEAKALMGNAPSIQRALRKLFGPQAYTEQGELDRGYIAKQVFEDRKLLEQLNDIVHPAVRNHFKEWAKAQEAPYVIQETALLFENGLTGNYDKIILVTAPKEVRIKRVMERDGAPREAVIARMRHQWEDGPKKAGADYIIENMDLEKTMAKIKELNSALLEFS